MSFTVINFNILASFHHYGLGVCRYEKYVYIIPNDWSVSGAHLLRMNVADGSFAPFVRDGIELQMPYPLEDLFEVLYVSRPTAYEDFINFSRYQPFLVAQSKSACSAGELGLIPGLGTSPGEGNGSSLQYSCLQNSMDRGAWQATVHGAPRVRHRQRLNHHRQMDGRFCHSCLVGTEDAGGSETQT